MAAKARKKGAHISRTDAKELSSVIDAFRHGTSRILRRVNGTIPEAEWSGLGRSMAEVWTAIGDELWYPMFDTHPDLRPSELELPERPKLRRRWGPKRSE